LHARLGHAGPPGCRSPTPRRGHTRPLPSPHRQRLRILLLLLLLRRRRLLILLLLLRRLLILLRLLPMLRLLLLLLGYAVAVATVLRLLLMLRLPVVSVLRLLPIVSALLLSVVTVLSVLRRLLLLVLVVHHRRLVLLVLLGLVSVLRLSVALRCRLPLLLLPLGSCNRLVDVLPLLRVLVLLRGGTYTPPPLRVRRLDAERRCLLQRCRREIEKKKSSRCQLGGRIFRAES
jgi:hypothetical protein